MKPILTILLSCIFIGQIHSTTFYIDPENGSINNPGTQDQPWSTLQEVIENGKIEYKSFSPLPYDPVNSQLIFKNQDAPVKSGDTLLLLSGLHGELFMKGAYNESYITIKAAENHTPIINKVQFKGGCRWRFDGITFSSEPYNYSNTYRFIFFESHNWQGPVYDVEVLNCNFYSTANVDSWELEDWLKKSTSAIYMSGNNARFINNTINTTSFGITLSGDSLYAGHNKIINFSGDGMRTLGSYNTLEYNLIKNCYNIDENHDDGIQSFNLAKVLFTDVVIRGNIIINYDDPNQKLRGPLQGIGCFDGPFTNWTIENNVISVDHWHGISLYGAYDCKIINNTVIDPTPEETPGPTWIKIAPHKDGTESAGNFVVNNIANNFQLTGSEEYTNVYCLSYKYDDHFIDYKNYDFRLKDSSSYIDAALAEFAPENDINGTARPQGTADDLGAYEYIFPVRTSQVHKELSFKIYPNPATEYIYVHPEDEKIYKYAIYSVNGELSIERFVNYNVQKPYIDIAALTDGIYFIKINDSEIQKFIKYSN